MASTASAPANAGVSAGSSSDKTVSGTSKRTQAGPGKNRKAKIDEIVSRVSNGDSAPNPDDALALRNPEDDLIPDISTALAAAKRAIAMAAVDSVRDVPMTFEKWVSSLPGEERDLLTASYLQYTAAESEWRRQTGESEGKGRKQQTHTMTGEAIQRLQKRKRIRQTAVCDRMSLAHEYIKYLNAGVAEGQVNPRIRASTSKASFIRTKLWTSAQRVSADVKSLNAARNILNRGIRELKALGCSGDLGSCGALAEMLDGGKRGRKKKVGG